MFRNSELNDKLNSLTSGMFFLQIPRNFKIQYLFGATKNKENKVNHFIRENSLKI